MRRCIFCMAEKEESQFNKEHIILDCLGGSGEEDLFFHVCKDCNSKLGNKVDSLFANDQLTQYYRFLLKIKGRNDVPRPFKNDRFHYDNTPITGTIITDKNGKVTGFRADCKVYDMQDGRQLVIAPRKHFHGYVKNYLKKNQLPGWSDEEIEARKLQIKDPKVPSIGEVQMNKEYEEYYMRIAAPLLLKMA